MRGLWVWLGAAWLFAAVPSWSQERALTLEQALELARERGAAVALAGGRVEEARARQAQAGRRFQQEPVVELNGGHRRADEDFFDFEAAVTQDLDAAGRRAARRVGAQAALERAEANLADVQRRLVQEAGAAFLRALGERERAALLGAGRRAADDLLAATERSYEAGETTALDLNRARTAAASARAGQGAAEADASAALAELKALLGIGAGEDIEVRGDLPLHPPPNLEALLASLDRRPDLQALAAELREAEAESLLGRSLARPDLGVRGGVAREEGADIITAGVVLTLPVHGRGKDTLAIGEARASALRRALEAARSAAEAEIRGRHAALSLRLDAVRELERTALPALDDNESLALKSFEAGEIGLGELLLIRRELLETRLTYLDRRLEAALTGLELKAVAGALP